ncbi:unnamed protein product [Sphagnum jensenii]|uniref:Uncharacterized protein n=1 Tax=Sphagnum jensenii TaxID=128206 RepID=A0ABP1B9V4_9BRYO
MLQIRKINKRIRFDSDPRPMQQNTRNMETQGKEGSGTPAQRSEMRSSGLLTGEEDGNRMPAGHNPGTVQSPTLSRLTTA